MNEAHDHLLFNHLPIIIPFVGFLIMIGGILIRSEIVKRTAYCIFMLGAILTMPAFFSGEGAEEVVENMPGIGHAIIHEHEEIAETFAALSYMLGALSIVGLWANWKQKTFSKILTFITLGFCLAVFFLAQKTGTSGGEIRHTEIRSGQALPSDGEASEEKKKAE
jgi:uncharacterized membrane protein